MPKLLVSSRAYAIVLALVVTVLAVSASASAAPWKFGVMSDTQWSGTDLTGNNVNTVAVNQIRACNQAFINAGVNLVVQVGDLTDTGSVASLGTRATEAQSLYNAGIGFFPLRGNHESSSSLVLTYKADFPQVTGASSMYGATGFSSSSASSSSLNYSFTYNNATFVLFDYANNPTQAGEQTWLTNTLSGRAAGTQAFVFSHPNLLGQNHKDNLFGSNNDANPSVQNAFIASLQDNGVRYAMSGHDHVHHRSIVTSPDGTHSVQEIISGSDSYKYDTPKTPYSSRETPIAQELYETSYYIYTVDGPKVTGQYFASTPLANGDVDPAAAFTLRETFGYSLNGKEFLVAQGGSYAGIADTYNGTIAQILGGTNGITTKTYDGRLTTKTVDTGWADASGNLASNVLTLWGINGTLGSDAPDTYVLSLSFDGNTTLPKGALGLVTRDTTGNWVNAVDLNVGGAKSFVSGAWNSSYGLGTYGIDLNTNTAWAVLNHSSDFAVSSVPEPSALVALATGLVGLGAGVRRRR